MSIAYLKSAYDYGRSLTPPVTARRVRAMCHAGIVPGAVPVAGVWIIPADAPDMRQHKYMRRAVAQMKPELVQIIDKPVDTATD